MNTLVSLTITTFVADAPTDVVRAVLAQALGAGETFQVDRRPTFDFLAAEGVQPIGVVGVGAVAGGFGYDLTFSSPGTSLPVGGIWYVRTVVAGHNNLTNVLPAVVILDANLLQPYCAGGRDLAELILANKPALDLYLQAADPRLGLRASVFGAEWNAAQATPGVLVKPLSMTQRYEAQPRGFIVQMNYSVTGIIRSDDAENEAEAIAQFMEALAQVLNQSAYETFVLSTGVGVNGGISDSFSFNDEQIGGAWASKTSFVWSWQYIRYTA